MTVFVAMPDDAKLMNCWEAAEQAIAELGFETEGGTAVEIDEEEPN